MKLNPEIISSGHRTSDRFQLSRERGTRVEGLRPADTDHLLITFQHKKARINLTRPSKLLCRLISRWQGQKGKPV